MNTEMNNNQNMSPSKQYEHCQGLGVTTSSGICFSMPSWAEQDSPASQPPRTDQAGPAKPYDEQYF